MELLASPEVPQHVVRSQVDYVPQKTMQLTVLF